MNKELYVEIIRETFLPYLHTAFPEADTHRFMQDNDPKRVQICSRLLGQQQCQLVENSCRVTRFESN